MYQDYDGIQLQSFGFEANILSRGQPNNVKFLQLCYIWDRGLECTLVVVYLSMVTGSRINTVFGG